MKRSLGVVVLVVAALASACSTHVYTSERAVRDLERQSQLTHSQAECVVSAVRKHFAAVITANQKANKLSKLPADRLELEVDNALASIREPSASEQTVARSAIAHCAPAALN